MPSITCDAIVLVATCLATARHSSWVLVFHTGLLQQLALQPILANFVMMFRREETTFVAPTSLLDATLDAPMPEGPLLAQAIHGGFSFDGLLIDDFIIDFVMDHSCQHGRAWYQWLLHAALAALAQESCGHNRTIANETDEEH